MNTATTFSTGLSSQDRLQRLIHSFFGSLEAQDVHLRSLSSTRMDPTSSPRQLTAPSSLTPTHGTVLPTCSMLTSQSELDSPREVSTMSRVRRSSLLHHRRELRWTLRASHCLRAPQRCQGRQAQ